jgi:S1-C subfamily serine protease
MPKLTPPDPVRQTLRERLASSQWQYWLAIVLPMSYITILTILLPSLLTQSFVVSQFGASQEQRLQQQLRSISIKVLARGESIGSGVLLVRKHQVYTVITNAHVIQSASVPFQIQTPDGQIYAAALITPPTGQNRDLSILRFQSRDRMYTPAKLATASPKVADRVWSSGFPLDRSSHPAKTASEPNIVSGQITQILPIAISGGYSIGSDRMIQKGMSGGPLIDRSGELIGINGVHADPLWDTPEVLEDGSTVNDRLQEQINNSNWAIPIEFVKDYARL